MTVATAVDATWRLAQLNWLKRTESAALDDGTIAALRTLADSHATAFFRPLLACAAADKADRLAQDLGQLLHLADVFGGKYMLLERLELTTLSKTERAKTAALLLQLEQRLSLVLAAREASQCPVPLSLFLLLMHMLAEIRLFVRITPHSRPNWIDLLLRRLERKSTVADHELVSWDTMRRRLADTYAQLSSTGLSNLEDATTRNATLIQRARLWASTTAPPSHSRYALLSHWSDAMRSRIALLAELPHEPRSIYLRAIMYTWMALSDSERDSVMRAAWSARPYMVGERARVFHSLAAQAPLQFQETFGQYGSHVPWDGRTDADKLGWLQVLTISMADRFRVRLDRLVSSELRRRTSNMQPPAMPFCATDIDTNDKAESGLKVASLEVKLTQMSLSDNERTLQERRQRQIARVLLQPPATMDGQERGVRQRSRLLTSQDQIHVQLLQLAHSSAAMVTQSALALLSMYECDEPGLLWRMPQALISAGSQSEKQTGLHHLREHIALASDVAPGSTYSIVNFLAGMAKHYYREVPEQLDIVLVEVLPLLAAVMPHTGGLSARDLRKNKVEAIVTRSAAFWPASDDHKMQSGIRLPLDAPTRERLQCITALRVAQAQLLTKLVQQSPQDALDLTRLISDFVPEFPEIAPESQGKRTVFNRASHIREDGTRETANARDVESGEYEADRAELRRLIELRARAWLHFLAMMIEQVDEHRVSAEHVVSIAAGLDCLLYRCRDDTDMLQQILSAYVRLNFRFHAILAQAHGERIILPALFDAYTALHPQPETAMIEATWCTLYETSPDAFLFAALWDLAPMIVEAGDGERGASYRASLLHKLLLVTDARTDEIAAQNWRPRRFSESVRRPSMTTERTSATMLRPSISVPLPSSPPGAMSLSIAQSILAPAGASNTFADRMVSETLKLLVTIVAYDPGSQGSEHFIRLFRLLLPHCLDNDVLSSCMDALSGVFKEFVKSSKYRLGTTVARGASGDGAEDMRRTQNDRIAIRREYVALMSAYAAGAGQLTWRQAKSMCVVMRATLKDLAAIKRSHDTDWVGDALQVLARLPDRTLAGRALETLLRHLAPIFAKLAPCARYSGLLDGVARALGEHGYGRQDNIRETVLERYVGPLLERMARRPPTREQLVSTGMLLAALLLHGDADVAPVFESVRPALRCRLLPFISTNLAQLTLAQAQSTPKHSRLGQAATASGTRTAKHSIPDTTKILSLWHYPLQWIDASYSALCALQSERNVRRTVQLGPSAKRVSNLSLGDAIIDDRSLHAMVAQLALALRAALIVLRDAIVNARPQIRAWLARLVRGLLAFLGGSLVAPQQPSAPPVSDVVSGGGSGRRVRTANPATVTAFSLWMLCDQLIADRVLLQPCMQMIRHALQAVLDADWWRPTGAEVCLSASTDASLPLTSGNLADRLHSATDQALATVYTYLATGQRPAGVYNAKVALQRVCAHLEDAQLAGC
ncbi:hypothetical protein THASP1DRAFT_31375 [Thamnocephalis sphaerospora]|uniref:Uncharacterized protein n=1 Tax=Thamnocephalis sphaerospora TaxID=78915 RepID=A0A4P9XLU7_9FUNG|nr:hypothetical protein THASP1DRAFT_31375 [Thamnocephalis sphaerospora]|eukprot:RKP06815.1 hypothetical protein THASP1DRAFT_31375 [Thamnocephalis sphaerospora]